MRRFLMIVSQLALLGLFDWIYFINDAKQWWAFGLLHAVVVVEFIALYVLRRMKTMPISKKHPIVVFTVYFAIQFIATTVYTLVDQENVRYILSIVFWTVFVLELLAFGALYLMLRHSEKGKEPKKEKNQKGKTTDTAEGKNADANEEENAPIKVNSSSMILLLQFLSNPGDFDIPEELSKDIDILTQIASNATQHSYDVLGGLEVKLKVQIDSLKSYIEKKSVSRAKATVKKIVETLNDRENQIDEIERN